MVGRALGWRATAATAGATVVADLVAQPVKMADVLVVGGCSQRDLDSEHPAGLANDDENLVPTSLVRRCATRASAA